MTDGVSHHAQPCSVARIPTDGNRGTMDKRSEGKVAIVTGGGDGIGYGICRRFASDGAKVLVAELDADAGERAAASLRDELGAEALFVLTDVSDRGQVA